MEFTTKTGGGVKCNMVVSNGCYQQHKNTVVTDTVYIIGSCHFRLFNGKLGDICYQ